MTLPITAFYALILATIMVILAFRVSLMRAKTGITLGDGNNPKMLERIRIHGNFTEFVPTALVLLALVEMNGAPSIWLHLIGGTMLLGRLAHPLGVHATPGRGNLRIAGTLLSEISIVIAVIYLGWRLIT